MTTLLFSTSCTTTRVIKSQPDTVQNELKKGDVVKITTKSGVILKIKVVNIGSELIIGDKVRDDHRLLKNGRNQQILFSEIAKIEKTSFSVGKSLGATIAMPWLLLLIFIAICPASEC